MFLASCFSLSLLSLKVMKKKGSSGKDKKRKKENNDRFGSIKINNFCSSRGTIIIVKTQTTNREKSIFNVWSKDVEHIKCLWINKKTIKIF